MKRKNLNLIVDIGAFAGFVLLTTTGILMRYLLPPGSGHHSAIWGMDRHQWGSVHFWVSMALFLVLTLHLLLHWRWIAAVVRGRPRMGSGLRAGLGIVGFMAVIALATAPLMSPVERGRDVLDSSAMLEHGVDGITIRGDMTLRDVESITGVPASHLIKKMNLPASVSQDQRLGALKTQYQFEMNEIRELVEEYRSKR